MLTACLVAYHIGIGIALFGIGITIGTASFDCPAHDCNMQIIFCKCKIPCYLKKNCNMQIIF